MHAADSRSDEVRIRYHTRIEGLDLFQDTDPRGKKTHTKSRDTAAQTRIAPRDLPQYLISFEVSFQERTLGLFLKELVYHIERSVPSN
jgi:hypothetical protein